MVDNPKGLIGLFRVRFDQLKDFNFSVGNPVFWLLLIILFLILQRIWGNKKAVQFCLIVSVFLLVMTKFEKLISAEVAGHGQIFDPLALRMAAIFVIAIVSVYYGLIKGDY